MAKDEGVLLKVTQHFVQKGVIVLAFWFGRRQVQRLTSKKPGALTAHWMFADATLAAAGCKHMRSQCIVLDPLTSFVQLCRGGKLKDSALQRPAQRKAGLQASKSLVRPFHPPFTSLQSLEALNAALAAGRWLVEAAEWATSGVPEEHRPPECPLLTKFKARLAV